jgi:hypothetical protein
MNWLQTLDTECNVLLQQVDWCYVMLHEFHTEAPTANLTQFSCTGQIRSPQTQYQGSDNALIALSRDTPQSRDRWARSFHWMVIGWEGQRWLVLGGESVLAKFLPRRIPHEVTHLGSNLRTCSKKPEYGRLRERKSGTNRLSQTLDFRFSRQQWLWGMQTFWVGTQFSPADQRHLVRVYCLHTQDGRLSQQRNREEGKIIVCRRHFLRDISIKLNSVAWVCDRTIPTERPSLVGEVSTKFAYRGCQVVSVTNPYGSNLGFLDRSSYFLFQVAPQLYSRGRVDPVPDPLLLRKSFSAGNWTRTSGSVARNCDH